MIRRLNRIFNEDGRALIVAMDHGLMDGPCKGLENPGETIKKIVKGGADAILTSYGVSTHFAKELARVGLIMRVDGGTTSIGTSKGPGSLFYRVEDAVRLGADAVAVSGFPAAPDEQKSLANIATVIQKAHEWGVNVLAEMGPGGFDSAPEWRTTENLALSARVGAELGADIIKLPYGSEFDKVTSGCYVPVVILGGAKRGKEQDMLADIKSAVDLGARGVAIGRNIWQSENPEAMTRAVAAILHENATIEAAMKYL
jgi:DhnA family fructose-bisphosphate aldolase class Ia